MPDLREPQPASVGRREVRVTKSRGILTPKHQWTDAEVALLRAQYPDKRAADVAALLWDGCKVTNVYTMAKRLGLAKSEAFRASPASGRLDGVRGIETRFKPGNVSNNNTAPMVAAGVATRFKKGQRPYNHVPVGTELVKHDGYVWRKIAEPNKWRQKHLLLWEETHGAPPAKGMKVCFKDGNRLNVVPDNLECIPQAELTRRNSIHRYPPELKEVIRLSAKVRRKLNERSEETHQ
jgi:hypothetical protein